MAQTLYQIFLLALLGYMIFRIIQLRKLQKNTNAVIDAIRKIDDEEAFFNHVEEQLTKATDPLTITKLNITKLWGEAIYKRGEDFLKTLDKVDIQSLIAIKNQESSIEANEDSFFYLYLSIPNILFGNKMDKEREALLKKTDSVDSILSNQLVVKLAKSCNQFYDQEGDLGESFYGKVLEGDYGDYKYSKQLISIYKSIANSMLAKVHEEKQIENNEDIKAMLEEFEQKPVGQRWHKYIDLKVELPEEETEEENNEEEESLEDVLTNKEENQNQEQTK